ncbi:hypothetical protein M1L60_18600 [Actinoplanes sp. TRM 88003]|uniref:Uncharacterized protein n=1 Tax=Paractinoplanes aksuensis TaxID=2939490 RepID=A0ABT1DQ48_9ACTN|nr:hypothetical protein [Actinoplanes aksuensis]MCO8272608.1 hypothetical protein [Actinoplanes aksuensis]
MPTRVLLEGPAIEPLLAQVRDEYGSRVRIISADKVRSGGVGGFFAKQHYELSVEVPDPNEDRSDMAQRTKTADNGQHSLERLLERAESQDRTDDPGRGTARPFGTSSPRSVTPASFGISRPAETPARPAAENNFGADEGRSAALGDTGAAFAELMAGLDAGNDRFASRPKPAPREDTPTVRPFRPAAAAESAVNAAPRIPSPPSVAPQSPAPPPMFATEPMAAPMPTVAPMAAPMPTVAPMAAQMPTVAPMSPAAPMAAPAPTAAAAPIITPAPAAPVAPEPVVPVAPQSPAPSLAERIGGLAASAVEIDPVPVATEPEPVAFAPVSPAPTAPIETAAADNEPVVRNLMSVGMPETMARQITGSDTYAGVLSVLAARPAAAGIPDGPGEILVLAGDLNLGVTIGRQLLDEIGVPENHLLLAAQSTAGTGLHSSRLISTAEAAEQRAEKLHSAEEPWVVVLEAPVGGSDPIWINEMCDAIGATAVWAVVDATRKTADTARHLRSLGEVESLVVHGVELTADPASVLGLDLPIHSLDGKPATPHAWAAMLCARIASDVMPVAAPPRRVTRSVRP